MANLAGRKTRKAYVMSKQKKYHDTSIELITRELLKKQGFVKQRYYTPKVVYIDEDGKEWDFEPDIMLPDATGDFNIMVLVNGPHHDKRRQTQIDDWEYGAYVSLGKRVIVVHHSILKTKDLQDYTARELVKAMRSDKDIVRIDA